MFVESEITYCLCQMGEGGYGLGDQCSISGRQIFSLPGAHLACHPMGTECTSNTKDGACNWPFPSILPHTSSRCGASLSTDTTLHLWDSISSRLWIIRLQYSEMWFCVIRRVGFKSERLGRSRRGLHRTEIESIDFSETFAYLKSRIFGVYF
jgi:hypothetical protein